MKKNVYYGKDDFRMEELESVEIGDRELLLKMMCCGVCGTDVHKAIDQTVSTPTVLGHEVSGIIERTGREVKDFKVGDRVFVAHHVPCYSCEQCRKHNYSLCPQFKATNLDPGGFSNYIIVSDKHIHSTMGKLPDGVSYEEGALVEPVACCLHGFSKVDLEPGDNVLIMGAGQIGIIQSQIARYKLANQIIVSDVNDFRLEKALMFGATNTINPSKQDIHKELLMMTNGQGIDLIIISAGISTLLNDAMNLIKRGGQILVFAPFKKEDVQIPAFRFFEDEIKVVGAYSSTPLDYEPALTMIKNKVINAQAMITHKFPLEELESAIRSAHDPGEHSLKVVITGY
ncbi:alcohol dehydrogenase catalytic domain-containing protein [Salinicoccus sesuvii]|uniref:Alcohol dehydrogenase catalytic domain-containing protein n=1 Tax=Salinicoccus sesuvii TaxID=868281 RepID=A0ABV7N1C2_9STAP